MINQKRLVQTLIDLIKIDSPSGQEKNIAKELVNRLKKLGCHVSLDNAMACGMGACLGCAVKVRSQNNYPQIRTTVIPSAARDLLSRFFIF